MISLRNLSNWVLPAAALLIAGCGTNEPALMCVDQSTANPGIGVSNRCNQTITIVTNDGERLVIPPGDTHQLLGAGKMLAACFSPDEPNIEASRFSCN